ncbi:MAG: SDR family oxidoreductase [Alphaproteobacteria bacterium]|nr:SDR family oxidoreductase [Alphaproteobacteria bacterium]MBU0792846.1 SDR family oxidoreductase [Alphaproteobacteria bacterium]MBU0874450.1 SDR family oxidoreductase [Alphaproteobacteria bacterium]MBU1769079.1 SDR family oxidoreductase [Alphaproteobacteria bacterium]
MKTKDNCILITGGGSGIGRELARRFHDLGNQVIVAGRTAETLAETIDGRADMQALTVDVSDATSIEAFVAQALARFPAINILFNNAGIMRHEDLTTRGDTAVAEQTFITNVLGPIRLTNALIDHLRAQDDAAIINTTSGLAFVPLIGTPSYSASKAALHSWTVSLREQLRGKVDVIELVPPAVRTELTPGQSTRESYMPLDDYAAEVMALFQQVPTPEEILVEKVRFLRLAEREGRFDETVRMISAL